MTLLIRCTGAGVCSAGDLSSQAVFLFGHCTSRVTVEWINSATKHYHGPVTTFWARRHFGSRPLGIATIVAFLCSEHPTLCGPQRSSLFNRIMSGIVPVAEKLDRGSPVIPEPQ